MNVLRSRCSPTSRLLRSLRDTTRGAAGAAGAVAAMLVAGAAGSAHAQLLMETTAVYQDPITLATETLSDSATSGELLTVLPAPGIAVFGPTYSEAYANASGTFWTYVTTGTLEPYYVESHVTWQLQRTKLSADERVRVEITGGYVDLLDTGGVIPDPMTGGLSFYASLDGGNVIAHKVEVAGRFDDWDLTYTHQDPLIDDHFDTSSVLISSGDDTARYWIDPVTIWIGLDTVAVGQTYTIRYVANSWVSGVGGETGGSAYFRDPVTLGGGIGVTVVPLPPTAWMLAAGLPLVLWARRRRTGPPAV